jgi:hypothetical protein
VSGDLTHSETGEHMDADTKRQTRMKNGAFGDFASQLSASTSRPRALVFGAVILAALTVRDLRVKRWRALISPVIAACVGGLPVAIYALENVFSSSPTLGPVTGPSALRLSRRLPRLARSVLAGRDGSYGSLRADQRREREV